MVRKTLSIWHSKHVQATSLPHRSYPLSFLRSEKSIIPWLAVFSIFGITKSIFWHCITWPFHMTGSFVWRESNYFNSCVLFLTPRRPRQLRSYNMDRLVVLEIPLPTKLISTTGLKIPSIISNEIGIQPKTQHRPSGITCTFPRKNSVKNWKLELFKLL